MTTHLFRMYRLLPAVCIMALFLFGTFLTAPAHSNDALLIAQEVDPDAPEAKTTSDGDGSASVDECTDEDDDEACDENMPD